MQGTATSSDSAANNATVPNSRAFVKSAANAELIAAGIAELGGIRAGYKTTQFWLQLIAALLTFALAFKGNLKPEYAAIIMAVQAWIYQYLRQLHIENMTPDAAPAAAHREFSIPVNLTYTHELQPSADPIAEVRKVAEKTQTSLRRPPRQSPPSLPSISPATDH